MLIRDEAKALMESKVEHEEWVRKNRKVDCKTGNIKNAGDQLDLELKIAKDELEKQKENYIEAVKESEVLTEKKTELKVSLVALKEERRLINEQLDAFVQKDEETRKHLDKKSKVENIVKKNKEELDRSMQKVEKNRSKSPFKVNSNIVNVN
mmetsp:Transcript_6697/g.5968  ORF Transcript_6697/g.5968 Transcript_6697/m.5968 type:complete len:152 (+) Transcript_6697:702-1157(+)